MEDTRTLVQSRGPGEDRRGEVVLDRYRLLERLGAGGFGVVWRAHDEQLQREVALKRIALPSPEDRERATREAHALARLSHPAIVSLYEACADEHAFYLISELVHGETLAALNAREELHDEQIAEIGLAIVAALEHAHARGVIHRDVKPQNVIVVAEPSERGGVAKLADFGGARLVGEDALTRTGDVLGTLAYMAPEQSEGGEAVEATDVYALALLLYEAFSGVHPVRGPTPTATARRIGRPIESLARHRRDLRGALTRTIDLALMPDPRRRATLDELRAALELVPREAFARGRASARHRRDRPAEERRAPAPPGSESHKHLAPVRRGRGLPRAAWLACVLALAIWQAASGRAGVSLLVLAAGAPLLLLPRRSGPAWLFASLAPLLGLLGLAGAYPALAGQARSWRTRAGLAALGFWWLTLAEPLLARRLWWGPAKSSPPRAEWEGSVVHAASGVLGSLPIGQLLVSGAVWALASLVLPALVRGRNAALDGVGAIAWAVALLAAPALLAGELLSGTSEPGPRGALLGAALGCVLAIAARALRGPSGPSAEEERPSGRSHRALAVK